MRFVRFATWGLDGSWRDAAGGEEAGRAAMEWRRETSERAIVNIYMASLDSGLNGVQDI